ncbi:MAG: twin-arginine translocase TatA/TatE family subunit [Candidatus Korobacteraceae bacterium]
MPDILFILLLAMIILGPKKLPQVAAQVAKYLAQFQRMKREVIEQVNGEILRLEKENVPSKQADGGEPSPMLASPQSLESRT